MPATFIEGQGQDQGAVKLDAKGVLSFADLDKNEGSERNLRCYVFACYIIIFYPAHAQLEGFYRASHRIGNVICESFESRDHPGYYLAGETVNSTAFGKVSSNIHHTHGMLHMYVCIVQKTTTPRDGAYWKKVHYSTVSGDITHFKQMSSDSPWYCLQYRGDVNSGDNPLYLVAHGKGAAATFSLQHDTDLIRDKSGIFSFL